MKTKAQRKRLVASLLVSGLAVIQKDRPLRCARSGRWAHRRFSTISD